MGDPHGDSGATIPIRTARRVLAIGLVWAFAWWLPAASAAEPGVLRPLPPLTETLDAPGYLSGTPTAAYVPSGLEVNQPQSSLVYGYEAANAEKAFSVVPAAYADPYAASVANSSPRVALRTGKSILNFNNLQGPPGTESGQGGAGSDAAESAQTSQDEGQDSEDQEGEGKKDGEQTFGQAPTNNSLQFLRQVDVLLKPGKWQLDTGFLYTLFSNDFPLPILGGGGEVTNVVEAEVRRRLLYTPLAVRYGFRKNIQLFASLPAGFSNTQLSTLGVSETQNVSGIGDLTAGASFHLFRGEDQMPDVIGTFGFTAPTGKFNTPVFGLVPGSNLGQGFWAISSQLLFINRYDPVIVFYGAGYRHLFEREFDGVAFAPGEQVNYMLGVGFSVNDRVTLSSTFQGFYITNSFIDGVNLRGSNLEPLSMRFSATIVRDCRILEPFCQFGLTDSAPRVNVGIVVTFY